MILDRIREPLPRRPTDSTYHQLGTGREEKIRADWPRDRRVRATDESERISYHLAEGRVEMYSRQIIQLKHHGIYKTIVSAWETITKTAHFNRE